MRLHATCGLCTVVLLLAARPAAAALATLTAVQDNTLYEDAAGSQSNGAGRSLLAGRAASGLRRRALLRFDVQSSVPPGSTIRSAVLTLYATAGDTSGTVLAAHRVARLWGEGTSRATDGEGAPAAPGDATWLHAFYDGVLWEAVGGDFEPLPSAAARVDGEGAVAWGSTAALVADVQSWLDQPATNAGWILIGDETAAAVRRLASREEAAPERRPKLNVEFVPPVASEARTWSGIKSLYRAQ
jgi:hypothetical protein